MSRTYLEWLTAFTSWKSLSFTMMSFCRGGISRKVFPFWELAIQNMARSIIIGPCRLKWMAISTQDASSRSLCIDVQMIGVAWNCGFWRMILDPVSWFTFARVKLTAKQNYSWVYTGNDGVHIFGYHCKNNLTQYFWHIRTQLRLNIMANEASWDAQVLTQLNTSFC